MYFVYILLCSDQSLYTGITKNPKQRFSDHLSGRGGAYTRSHKPLKIIYLEKLPDKSTALKREAEIKSWTKLKKITTLGLET